MEQITSDILPQDAVSYLNEIEQKKEAINNEIEISGAKQELLSHCLDFKKRSADWRKASYEVKWEKYQRNADGIFDPDIANKKADWQSKVHVGITASHRETIHSHIFKTIVGVNPPLEISARYELGDLDQSKNIQDIILREMDKARWGVEIDKVMHDADTFGSGFLRMYYKTTIEKRKLRKEQVESFTDNLNPMGMMSYIGRAATGKLKKEYVETEEDVLTYRGLCLTHCSIWDVFPDPKALKIRGNAIAYRFYATYEDILKGIEEGYYLPSAAVDLKNVKGTRKYADGEDLVNSNREVSDSDTEKTDYQQEYELFEFFCRLPKKWIYKIMGQQFENGEELVPARVIFHDKAIVGVEVNQDYEGEAPIYKMDYMPRNGSFYGVGVPEMLMDSQDVINEIVNQRLDNGAIALNATFAVVEKALVNPKQDLKSRPGQMVRLDSKYVPNGDIRNAITQFSVNDTPLRAGFSEVNEAERWAQERTSANRVTLGTAGLVKDANQTLGGQQILRESAGEKFSYIGLRMEIDFLQEFFRGIWKTIYPHLQPEDIEDSIGPERAAKFILISPDEFVRDMEVMPKGVYSMENKAQLQAQVMQIRQAFVGAPWADDEKYYDFLFNMIGQDPKKFKKTEEQILQEQAQMIQPEATDLTGAPMPPEQATAPEPTAPPVPAGTPNIPGPDEIKQMYKSGAMTREMAVNLLKQNHGYK